MAGDEMTGFHLSPNRHDFGASGRGVEEITRGGR
jgi:hypothetical protein